MHAKVHVHVDVLVHASMHAYVLFRAGVHARAVHTEHLEKVSTFPEHQQIKFQLSGQPIKT